MRERLANISLLLLSLLFSALLLEVGARVFYGELFSFHSFLEVKRKVLRTAYPVEFDRELGWIPRRGSAIMTKARKRVTIQEDGVRSNGGGAPPARAGTILAVGDSFTFGAQVSDSDTWPARLEARGGTRVVNGGVFGYGVDQTYLRMLSLAARYKPGVIVFSFIPDDIGRCELSARSAPKPYFVLSSGDDLELVNEHIPLSLPEARLDPFRKALGYSLFAHTVLSAAAPEYWLQGPDRRSTRAHSDGAAVACRIFKKLGDYAQAQQVEILVLVQYPKNQFEEDLGVVDDVLSCVDRNALNVVDLREPLAALKARDADRYRRLFSTHMTRKGNEFVAGVLLEALGRR